MKFTLSFLLSGLLLCGCSQKPAAAARPAIDLVEVGHETVWNGGYVLHVSKRNGTSLEGILVTETTPDGKNITLNADTARFLRDLPPTPQMPIPSELHLPMCM